MRTPDPTRRPDGTVRDPMVEENGFFAEDDRERVAMRSQHDQSRVAAQRKAGYRLRLALHLCQATPRRHEISAHDQMSSDRRTSSCNADRSPATITPAEAVPDSWRRTGFDVKSIDQTSSEASRPLEAYRMPGDRFRAGCNKYSSNLPICWVNIQPDWVWIELYMIMAGVPSWCCW